MVGTGKPRKPFYVNTALEASFKTEGVNQRAISGSIKEAPAFDPQSNPIGVPRHSELGVNFKVLKGKFEGAFGYSISIHDMRNFAHVMGGRIDQIRTIAYTVTAGVFLADEPVDDDVTGAEATILSVTATRLKLKLFVKDEVVNFTPSSAVGVFKYQHGNVCNISTTSGVIADDDVMTGATSGATAKVDSATGDPNITLFLFGDGNTISNTAGSTATGTQTDNYYNHSLWVTNSPAAQTLFYNYESLANQHNLLGSVLNNVELSSVVNDAPSIALQWMFAKKVKDATKDAEVTITPALEPYEYTAFDLSVDSVDYSALFQSVSATMNRDYESTDSHDALEPSGFTTSSFASTLKASIFKEDEVLLDLESGDTRFPILITMLRGVVDEDDAILTYANCKMLKPSEGGDKKIMLEVPFEVEGTPTMVINDLIDNYD